MVDSGMAPNPLWERGASLLAALVSIRLSLDVVEESVVTQNPVIDAGWLPKTRQVGKSGLEVKPEASVCQSDHRRAVTGSC